MNIEQKEKVVAALKAGVTEIGIFINSWSFDMEDVQGRGEWGKNRAVAIQRDIERAESVQNKLLDAIEEIWSNET